MSPTIVYGPDGHVRLAVGAAGGATIPAQVAKAIIGVIDWHLRAQEAIALADDLRAGRHGLRRTRHLPRSDVAAAAARWATRGRTSPPGTFKANAIEWINGRWVGAADPRSEGAAVAQ